MTLIVKIKTDFYFSLATDFTKLRRLLFAEKLYITFNVCDG